MSFFSFISYNKSATFTLILFLAVVVAFSTFSFSAPEAYVQQDPQIADDSNVGENYKDDGWGDWEEPETPGIFDTLKERFGRLLSYLRGDDLDETDQDSTNIQEETVASIDDQYEDNYEGEDDGWGDWEDPEYPDLFDVLKDRFSRWISYMRGDDIDEAMEAEKNDTQKENDERETTQTQNDVNEALLPEDEGDFNWGITQDELNDGTEDTPNNNVSDDTQNEIRTNENTQPSKPNNDTVIDGIVIDDDDSDVTDDLTTNVGCVLPSKQEWNNVLPPGFTYTILGGKYAKVTNSRPYCGVNSQEEFKKMAEKTVKLLQCPTASVTNISYTDVTSSCTFFVQFGN